MRHLCFSFIKEHSEVFYWNPQKSKTLAMFFMCMFMMLLVSSSNSKQIGVFGVFENFKSLMNENIMHKKISHSVQCNSYSYIKIGVKIFDGSIIHQSNRRNCEYGKKIIISFRWNHAVMWTYDPVRSLILTFNS